MDVQKDAGTDRCIYGLTEGNRSANGQTDDETNVQMEGLIEK
jgi:hypothetical protein